MSNLDRSAVEGAKDAVLDHLSESVNVAQFISFAAGELPSQRFCRIAGVDRNLQVGRPLDGIELLLERSPEHSVNVRSFRTEQSKAGPFEYGLTSAREALNCVQSLAGSGWHTIVNETIDINDGGVSGVALGDVVEFAPCDTPRCVEKAGVCRLPRNLAIKLLEEVYHFEPEIGLASDKRIEFSIHPLRRGIRHEHTIIWEVESASCPESGPTPRWPNRFSEFIGDKVFGLLIADAVGLPVPKATVICRNIAPFTFGTSTGTGEPWFRTAPGRPVPGKFITQLGWCDPFTTVARESTTEASLRDANAHIVSVLSQEGVDVKFSGGAASTESGEVLVEGVGGLGTLFMLGAAAPSRVPSNVESDVVNLLRAIETRVGPARIEWAHDGHCVWVLQLHLGRVIAQNDVVVHGEPDSWVDFDISKGLSELRLVLEDHADSKIGIRLLGDVGITSHFGDLLRSNSIPSRIERH